MEAVQWEHEKLAKVTIRAFRGHAGGVNTCCFVGNKDLVLSGGDDHTLRLWSMREACEKMTMSGHQAEVTCCRTSNDARKISSTSLDKYLIIWDALTGQPLVKSRHDGMAMSCDISYDGKYVLSASDLDNVVLIWDLRQEKSIKTMNHHSSTVTCCRFARHSYRFCTTSMDLSSTVGDILNYRDNVQPRNLLKLSGHVNMVSSCDFSGDERRLCTGSWDKNVLVWDVHAGSYRHDGPLVLEGYHDGCISACRFTHDGCNIISSSYDENLVIWDVENACKKFSLQGHTGWVTDCDFSSDELHVVSSSKDGSVRVWNIENSDEIPVVLQNKKNIGLQILQCFECNKQFSIAQAQDTASVKYCVFCRLEFQNRSSIAG